MIYSRFRAQRIAAILIHWNVSKFPGGCLGACVSPWVYPKYVNKMEKKRIAWSSAWKEYLTFTGSKLTIETL